MDIGFDMADIKPTLLNVVVITFGALIGLSFLKFAANRWPIPGFTDLVNMV